MYAYGSENRNNILQHKNGGFSKKYWLYTDVDKLRMPGVGLMAGVVGLGSERPEFKSHSAVELLPGRVDCLSSF